MTKQEAWQTTIKACKKCGQIKPLFDFYKNFRLIDGHSGSCKDCSRSYNNDRAKLRTTEQRRIARKKYRSSESYLMSRPRKISKGRDAGRLLFEKFISILSEEEKSILKNVYALAEFKRLIKQAERVPPPVSRPAPA